MKGDGQGLIEAIDEDKLKMVANLRCQRIQVSLVTTRQDDGLLPRASGSQDLLLDPTHRQHSSPQRQFTRHRHVSTHWPITQQRYQRQGQGDTCRRAILRHRAGRQMDMQGLLLEEPFVDIESLSMSADVGQDDSGRLLHHVAELTRQLEALATHSRRFDHHDFASSRRPSESRHDPREIFAIRLVFLMELCRTKIVW